ncbi:MAG: CRISPR-associated endonuclease Cas2 [Kiritimatiellia bacterium]
MWLLVMFDLPVETKAQSRIAARFRKSLLKDGYVMHQFSVYIRPCASMETATTHIKRVKLLVPDEGIVSIVRITDKQFADTIQFVGKKRKPQPKGYAQLEFW